MRRSYLRPAILGLLVAAACHDSGPAEPEGALGPAEAAASITASDLRTQVELLAHDSMRGRWTPSPELEQVARHVASRYAGYGLASGYGADFQQWYTGGSPPADFAAMNTIGWIAGSDPVLRGEYVVVTAHMDHVGVRAPVNGDSIYNGADDNASGTAAVLELAQAFGMLATPPRRSLVFITFSGEERGLLGSEAYSEDPAFPMAATIANLNLDMIGRNWPDTVIAYRSPGTIGPLAESIAAAHPELGLSVIDDPTGSGSALSRSDQYHFYRLGVPVLLYHSGLHADYHQPSDEPETLDYEKMARITRLVFLTALDLAQNGLPGG